MSEEQSAGVTQGPTLTGKRLVRAVSNTLKWLGFRYGAPIHRAEAHFTIDQALQALRAGEPDSKKLGFTTKRGRDEVWLEITSVRNYPLDEQDFLGNLFGGGYRPDVDNCFVLEGLLLESTGEGNPYLSAAAYDTNEPFDIASVPSTPDDKDLKVLAIVACDDKGDVLNAIVQKVPSPADELLYIPQPWSWDPHVTVGGYLNQCGYGIQTAHVNAVLNGERHEQDTNGFVPSYSVTFTNVPSGGGWAWIVVTCAVNGGSRGHWVKVARPMVGTYVRADLD